MSWRWTDQAWTATRLQLAHAVFERTRREAPYAPMTWPLGHNNVLLRAVKRQHVAKGPPPPTITEETVNNAIRVRDAAVDQSRFTGVLPGFSGRPPVSPRRGGLYASEDIRAVLAEMLDYTDSNLARSLIDFRSRLPAFEGNCLISLRPSETLDVVNLQSGAAEMLPFLRGVEQDPTVASALRACRYDDLFAAVYAAQDYSAARGLGLGLESNASIAGIRVVSARDYEADGAAGGVLRNGDNVVLFGQNMQPNAKVVIQSMHLVDAVPGAHELCISNYLPAAKGTFKLSSQTRFVP